MGSEMCIRDRFNSGKFAKPTFDFSLKERPIKLDQVGAPITKALVPSIGSIDHWKWLSDFLSSNSSPMIESFGNLFKINDLIYFSNDLSKLVTGSKSFLFFDLLFTLIPDFDFFCKMNLILQVKILKN